MSWWGWAGTWGAVIRVEALGHTGRCALVQGATQPEASAISGSPKQTLPHLPPPPLQSASMVKVKVMPQH